VQYDSDTLRGRISVYWNKSRRLGACPTMKIIIYATTRRRSALTDAKYKDSTLAQEEPASVIFCSGGACRQTVIQAQAERSFQREKARVRHTTKLSGRLAEEECWNVIFGSGFIQPLYYYFGLCLPINVSMLLQPGGFCYPRRVSFLSLPNEDKRRRETAPP